MDRQENDPHRYDDIIMLPHHVSVLRPHMSLHDRAAQFAPFKALTGYEDAIEETARPTADRIEPDEGRIEQLDARLRLLRQASAEHPVVSAVYFRADERKEGGAYLSVSGRVRKIDLLRRALVLEDGAVIDFDSLLDLQSPLFSTLDEEASC